MIHHPDERNQIALLHDRHKNFSMEVYDHKNDSDTKKLEDARKNLKQTAMEVEALMKKLGI